VSTRFRPLLSEQRYLLPRPRRTGSAEGHLAYFIAEIVDTLEVERFLRTYEGDGRRNSPYDAEDAVEGAGVRVRERGVQFAQESPGSWKRMWRFRVLVRELSRSSHGEPVSAGAFGGVRGDLRASVKFGAEMKLIRMGTLAIDGTKVRANASKRKGMSYVRMKEEERKLKGEIAELLRRAQAVTKPKMSSMEWNGGAMSCRKSCGGARIG